MKINKQSWHYRFNNWYAVVFINRWWNKPESLCRYFWHTVWNCFKIGLVGLLVVVFVFGTFFLGKDIYVNDFLGLVTELYPTTGWEWLLFPLIGITACFIFLFVTGYLIVFMPDQIRNLITYKPRIVKTDSLALSYLRAKKEKICPIIDWSDNE